MNYIALHIATKTWYCAPPQVRITTNHLYARFVVGDPNHASRPHSGHMQRQKAGDVMLALTVFNFPAICLAQMLNTLLHAAQKAHIEKADAYHRQRQHKVQLAGTPTQAMPPSCCQIDLEQCCCQAANSTHRLTGPTFSGMVSKSLTSLRSRSLSCDPSPDRSTSGTSCFSPICTNTLHTIWHRNICMQAAQDLSSHSSSLL